MRDFTIAFLGGGNMAGSLIGGLVADGFDPAGIRVGEPDANRRAELQQRYAVTVTASNLDALDGAGVVVLGVKPQVLPELAEEIAAAVQDARPLLLSVAAGVRTGSLARWLGGKPALVRCMPNTAALVHSAATALYANEAATEQQRDRAETIMRAVGLTLWVDEEEALDAVTAISGSGPAYFFLFMEALQNAAVELGLDSEAARLLTLQTAFGAAKLALESADPVEVLRQRVTSPGGTTERALREFSAGELERLVARAAEAACRRARELADDLEAS